MTNQAHPPDLGPYQASTEPGIVEVPSYDFAMISGVGDPSTSPDYEAAVAALYAYSYPLVIALNKTARPKLKVGPLEGLWWADDHSVFDPTTGDRARWHWQMMIRQPPASNADHTAALAKAAMKVGAETASRLTLQPFAEGRCAQVLHLGAYTDESPTITRLHAFIAARGMNLRGRHHEIYLNDPRKTTADKLRTILRQPLA